MFIVPKEMRKELKKPLGTLMQLGEFIEKYGKMKIIAVGDIVTISLLERGIKPFLAVYDFRTMRVDLEKKEKKKIKNSYFEFCSAQNQPGTINEELEKVAKKLIKKGGALFIDGEEDLSTLVFMKIAPKDCIIVYGQPNKGVVAITCNKKSKKLAASFLKK
ncbi:MAG: DUF359 domain-containing protein [Candidatus Micrarchaeota archaeon]